MRKGRSATGERSKALASIHQIARVLGDPESTLDAKLADLISTIRETLQRPESAHVRITLDQCHASTPGFNESENGLSVSITTQEGKKRGSIEVVYEDETPPPLKKKAASESKQLKLF